MSKLLISEIILYALLMAFVLIEEPALVVCFILAVVLGGMELK